MALLELRHFLLEFGFSKCAALGKSMVAHAQELEKSYFQLTGYISQD